MTQDSAYQSVTVEEFLDHNGIEYRATSGSRGPQFNIRECPVCGGDAWKVYLSRDTGYGNCFHGSCESRFNLWTFAKAFLKTDDPKAIGLAFDEIAKLGGWRPKPKRHEAAAALTGAVKLPTSFAIPDQNVEYLANRGVPVEIARQFGLRMCLDGAFSYFKEDGSPALRSFSGRLIIPIYDLDAQLVTFQGRAVDKDLEPKYLFPNRLPSTARFIYNGHTAAALGWGHVVMGEGAFDTIAIQMAINEDPSMQGMGAVGSFGKKLTLDVEPGQETQLQSLLTLKAKGLRKITIMWDGEAKALVAALKAAKRLRGFGFEAFIAFLPKGKDPAEVSSALVRHAINSALPYSTKLELKVRAKNPYA